MQSAKQNLKTEHSNVLFTYFNLLIKKDPSNYSQQYYLNTFQTTHIYEERLWFSQSSLKTIKVLSCT